MQKNKNTKLVYYPMGVHNHLQHRLLYHTLAPVCGETALAPRQPRLLVKFWNTLDTDSTAGFCAVESSFPVVSCS